MNKFDINEDLIIAMNTIKEKLENFVEKGSGWIYKVDKTKIYFNKYVPLTGSNYIPLPDSISKKQGCINIKNNDNRCFEYALCLGLMEKQPKDHKYRPSNYNLETIQKPKNIEYPISIKDVS
eukprot:Lithocolla_globosa_v1_NODE_360_length_4320_cov_124.833529.p2 type:complete len:122 gc:universal NODE_360_length_4320_cov_124.833529:3623-3258(-)